MVTDRRRLLRGFLLAPWLGVVAPVSAAAIASDAIPPVGGDYLRPEWLADAGWLREHLSDPRVRGVALTPADAFEAGHIPRAVQIDWPDLEVIDTSDPSIARWQGEVEAKLTRLGVASTDAVVIYDDGTLFVARLWWALHQLGHADKRILNGGRAAWAAAGGDVEMGPSRAAPAATPYAGTPRPEVLAQLSEVEAAQGDPTVVLVDARSADEYTAGHIPGAVNVAPAAPRYWKPAAELRALYAAAGVTPDKRIIPYCTTGVRSAVTYFTLGLLGYDDVALYTGSWAEWSAHPELPKTTGTGP